MEPRKPTEDDTYVLLEFSPRKQIKIKKEGDEGSQIMVKQESEGNSRIKIKKESDGSSHSQQLPDVAGHNEDVRPTSTARPSLANEHHNIADSQTAAEIAKLQQKANELGAREVELHRECIELKACIERDNHAIEQAKIEVAVKTEDVKKAIATLREKIQSANEALNDEIIVKFMSAIETSNTTYKMGDDLRSVMVVKDFDHLVDRSFAAMNRVLNDNVISERGCSVHDKLENGKSFIQRLKNKMDTKAKVVDDMLNEDLVKGMLDHGEDTPANSTEEQPALLSRNEPTAKAANFRVETTQIGERIEELQGLSIESLKCREAIAAEDTAISKLTDAVKQATHRADKLMSGQRIAKACMRNKLIPAGIEVIFKVYERMLFYEMVGAELETRVRDDLQGMDFDEGRAGWIRLPK
ncbi:hypothetical protein HDK64DRAFT_308157 [Phyllosticta capitalensis]